MMHANDGQVTPKTQPSLEESADIKAANSRYIIEKMKELDDTNLSIFCAFIDGLVRKNSLEIKTALDRGVEYNGSMPVLLEAYATFGIVPYVLEGAA